jgi:enoyl-CoA hydratase
VEFVQYNVVDHVGVITLDRADKANAQTTTFLDEINSCWRAAAGDPEVRVVLVQANGAHFSAGMDLSAMGAAAAGVPSSTADAASYYTVESVYFIGNTLAWRNVPKPSIAAVQGKCVAAGLMLCWPCDLIIAAENAEFSDPTMRMGMAGVEYMAHVWELGARKAKEMLFRSTPITAEEARSVGMVNRVVPLPQLREVAMAWAREIAGLDPAMAALVKRGINAALDTQGFSASIAHGFDLQELGFAYQAALRRTGAGSGVGPDLLHQMRRTNPAIADRSRTGTDDSAG